jgi:aryl-alcohol dehydrogenase-like predicted oxidoreductase
LHGGTIDDTIDETIEAFETLQRAGKILHYGISSIRPNVIREYVKRSRITSVMMQYSLLDRRPEESVLELLQANGIGVLARGPLAQGLLAGKPAREYLGQDPDTVRSIQLLIRQFLASDGSSAGASLGYVLTHPAVTSSVVGPRTVTQLDDLLAAHLTSPLSREAYLSIRDALSPQRYVDHR